MIHQTWEFGKAMQPLFAELVMEVFDWCVGSKAVAQVAVRPSL